METRDQDRIRFVTRYFNDLQGLQSAVPLGLITLGCGVVASQVASWPLAAALILGAFLLTWGARRYYQTLGEVEPQPVHSAVELDPVSVFDPTGPGLQGHPLVTPVARHFLVTMGIAVALFAISLAMAPNVATGSVPRLTLDDVGVYAMSSDGRQWKAIEYEAVAAQTVCLLCGSFFLGVWLWRERRSRHYLVLGAVLLGLAAFGAFLGYLVGEDTGEIVRIIDFFLPAVAHLWVALLVCGSSMILAGLLDHWQLVRALGRPRGVA